MALTKRCMSPQGLKKESAFVGGASVELSSGYRFLSNALPSFHLAKTFCTLADGFTDSTDCRVLENLSGQIHSAAFA
ncbi:MAG: hypothetical protein HEQ15_08575 [Betaproteobacteria bacterium]